MLLSQKKYRYLIECDIEVLYPIQIPWGLVKVEVAMEDRRHRFIVQHHTITRNMIPRMADVQNCYSDDEMRIV